ncbi:hypothetical protein [Balneola vulgaris]|uniref:hypothetical protein n=1 Tax=Balneola vulgaris TaxID=287535 RepID=UPI00035CD5E1|nr:hypothetical protein [Balneola vulgaris]
MPKHLLNILLVAISLFVGVVIGFFTSSFIQDIIGIPDLSSEEASSSKALIIFIVEIVRAIPTYWLYLNHDAALKTLKGSIIFGLMCSFLLASLYIVLAPFSFEIHDVQRHITNNVFIFTLQGIFCGYVLWKVQGKSFKVNT